MSLIVQKFGGTSLGTPDRILSVAKRISEAKENGNDLVVVVSAMGQSTDELIDLAHQVSKVPPGREMDMLLTAGERISMALLSMALSDLGVKAISLTGSQTGIITDQSHRRARIQRILGDRVRKALQDGLVVIVAGFQGVSETKEITTLGRGGSDTTAVALAASLKAERCEIYTDVNGVMSADPRLVPEAQLWPNLPHDIMVTLATLGAGVLHPRCVELGRQFGVAIEVKNSLNEDNASTRIEVRERAMTASSGMEDFRIAGVTSDQAKFLIRVDLMRPTVLGALWDRSAEAHLSIVAPLFTGGHVEFFADRESEGEWKKILDRLSVEGFVSKYELALDLIPISVVGDRFAQDGRALGEIIDTLTGQNVQVSQGVAGPLSVTLSVPKSFHHEAVRALHDRFLSGKVLKSEGTKA